MAKVMAAMTLGLPALVLVGLTGFALHGVRLAGWRWLLMLGLLWVGSAPFAALGVLIGRLTDGEVAYGITSGIWFALAAPSGMWMPVTLFPHALRTISGMLPSSRFAELGCTRVHLQLLDLDDLDHVELIARDVMPHV